MHKSGRQTAILNIISTQQVESQSALAEILRERNFGVTQASVSRDLEELGIIKIDGVYTIPRKLNSSTAYGLISLEPAGGHLVVAKCESGLASAITVKIDGARLQGVAGTIAGDDTIFIAVREPKHQKAVIKSVWELFG